MPHNSILHVINQATTDPKDAAAQAINEKKLARLFLEYARTGSPITTKALEAAGSANRRPS